jgi:hypothetical protein
MENGEVMGRNPRGGGRGSVLMGKGKEIPLVIFCVLLRRGVVYER